MRFGFFTTPCRCEECAIYVRRGFWTCLVGQDRQYLRLWMSKN